MKVGDYIQCVTSYYTVGYIKGHVYKVLEIEVNSPPISPMDRYYVRTIDSRGKMNGWESINFKVINLDDLTLLEREFLVVE